MESASNLALLMNNEVAEGKSSADQYEIAICHPKEKKRRKNTFSAVKLIGAYATLTNSHKMGGLKLETFKLALYSTCGILLFCFGCAE